MSNPSHWYELVPSDKDLVQGDFLDDFPVIDYSGSFEDGMHEANIIKYDMVVMTQSCDLYKIRSKETYEQFVILCPRSKYFDVRDSYKWKYLKAGNYIRSHLLNKCEIKNHQFSYQVVELNQIFSVPYSLVREMADRNERIRLVSPYREHLSQAFARQFMRVGLPNDLPSEEPEELNQ
jgi:hypothetical protein